jgi:hypothetical protein
MAGACRLYLITPPVIELDRFRESLGIALDAGDVAALQLRPLQLRIADAVARGPEDQPPAGLAEQAVLENGVIQLQPADPVWPVSG